MQTENQKIEDNSDLRKYFTMLPNMAVDDLNPYQGWLYAHYVRVCGSSGERACFERVKTTAEKTHMATGQVSQVRKELEELGYISCTQQRKNGTVSVTIIDRWRENVDRYAPQEGSVHDMNEERSLSESERSPDETKNNYIVQEEQGREEKQTMRKRRSITDTPQHPEGTGSELAILRQKLAIFLLRLPMCWEQYTSMVKKYEAGKYAEVEADMTESESTAQIIEKWYEWFSEAERFSASNMYSFVFWFYHESTAAWAQKNRGRLPRLPTNYKQETMLRYWNEGFLPALDDGYNPSLHQMPDGVTDVRDAVERRRGSYMSARQTGFQEEARKAREEFGDAERNF